MVEPFAGSSSVAMVNKTKLLWYQLWKGLVEGTVEGFCSIMCNETAKKKNN
jgi:hypothetical protein